MMPRLKTLSGAMLAALLPVAACAVDSSVVPWKIVPYRDSFLNPLPELAFDIERPEMWNLKLYPRYLVGPTNLTLFADHFGYVPRFKGCEMGFVAHASLAVPTDGVYGFEMNPLTTRVAKNSVAFRLAVDGVFVDERPGGELSLKAGVHHVAVYVRRGTPEQERGLECGVACFSYRWKKPGDVAFGPMPLSAPTADQLAESPLAIGHVWTAKDELQQRFVCFHTYPLDIPEDGYYLIAWRGPGYLAQRWVLEDMEILYDTPKGGLLSVTGYPWDCWGQRCGRKLTYWGEQGVARYFKQGHYRLSASTYRNYFDVDEHPQWFADSQQKFYWRKLDGKNPVTDACFWLDTDSLVFRAGESLTVKAGRPGEFPANYRLEITRSGETNVVYSQTLKIGAAPTAFTYACPQEGAFEFSIRDDRGRVPFGPYEFVVVDVKGAAKVPRQTAAALTSVTNGAVRIDRWDVSEGPGGEHLFRDNGTSAVMDSPYGKYRRVGPWNTCSGYVHLMKVPGEKWLRYQTEAEKKNRVRADACLQQADWFAVSFKVKHLNRTHLLRFRVPNFTGKLGTTLIALDRKTGGKTAVSFLSGYGEAGGPWAWGSCYVWPNTDTIDVMVANTSHPGVRFPENRRSAVAEIELWECPEDGVEPLREAAAGWTKDRQFTYSGEQMDIGINESTTPTRWRDDQGGWISNTDQGYVYRNWKDFLQSWERWGENAAARGETLFLAPVSTYVMSSYAGYPSYMMAPSRDPYDHGGYSEALNPVTRDVFAMMLLVAEKHGVRMGADFMSNRIRPHVMRTWAKIQGRAAETNGIYLAIDAQGTPFTAFASPNAVNPAHPVIRKQLIDFNGAMGRRYGKYPAFAGIRYRQWTACPSDFEPMFLCQPSPLINGKWQPPKRLGYDDWTVGEFVKSMISASRNGRALSRPSLQAELSSVGADQAKWEARRQLIETKYLAEWDAWRTECCFTLREEMLAALRQGAPNAQFYCSWESEPVWQKEAGLDPKRYVGRRDLGFLPEQIDANDPGIELASIDARYFANFNRRPAPYTNSLPANVNWTTQWTYPSLPCCDASIRAHPYQLEKPAKALAENRLLSFASGPCWMLPVPDDGLRAFVQVYRAIPELKYEQVKKATADDIRVCAVWQGKQQGKTVFFAVNRTDMTIEVKVEVDNAEGVEKVEVENMVTGERKPNFTFTLAPFMPAVFRLGGTRSVASYVVKPSAADQARLVVRGAVFRDFAPEVTNVVWTNGVTYAQAQAELESVRTAGRWMEYERRLREFPDAQRWYFDVGGWPEGVYFQCPYRPGGPAPGWQVAIERNPNYHRLLSPLADSTVEDFAPDPSRPEKTRKYLRVKKGVPLKWNFSGTSRPRRLGVWGVFGGGYGSIQVEQVHPKRRVVGVLPRGKTKDPRLEYRELPTRIPGGGVYGTEVILTSLDGDMLIEFLSLSE